MSDTAASLDPARTTEFVDAMWDEDVLSTLTEFVSIPNKSPHFDADWEANGHMDRAAALVAGWCKENVPPGTTVETVRLEGRTPVIFMECPATDPSAGVDTVLLYGHLDKQPEMTGWDEGLGPWTPVLRDGRLYGRGGADDGYAAFACVTALRALADQGVAHKRCVVLIEACEESGSFDLPHYIEHLADRIGEPSLVVCLDSGCGNYEQLWCTTSLRGIVAGTLRVDILDEGVHSGHASGIVPSSFRILRSVLSRIEDQQTGWVLLPECHTDIPEKRIEQARRAAEVLGAHVVEDYPFVEGAQPMAEDGTELLLNRSWRPTLSVTGAAGLPAIEDAGNVLRPFTSARLSVRVPPTCPVEPVVESLRRTLESDPPYGARVRFENAGGADGWDAPEFAPWLSESLAAASQAYFGKDMMTIGQGGSIPFMAMLGERFPQAQFVITGVLGPGSNAHGPNEFLDLAMARRVTCCVAQVLRDHNLR